MAICPNEVKWIVPILAVVSTLFEVFAGVASIYMRPVIPRIVKVAEGVVITCKYPANPLVVVPGFLSFGFLVTFSLIGFPFLFYRRVIWSCKFTFVALFPIAFAALAAMSNLSPTLEMLDYHKNVYVDHNPSSSSTSSCPNFSFPFLLGSMFPLFSSIFWSFAIKFFEEEDSSHKKCTSKVVPTSDVT